MPPKKFQALVNYPDIHHSGFHAFRNRYDPWASVLREHITFIFPIPDLISEKQFASHVKKVLSGWQPFEIVISGFHKTIDHWLMLDINEGNDKVVALHDELYTGILKPYLRKDLPYTPHVGLGFFGNEIYDFNDPTAFISLNSEKYNQALSEINEGEIVFRKTIETMTIIELNGTLTSCTDIETFVLK